MKENGSRVAQQKQCCLWRTGLAVKQKQTNKQKRVTNNSDMDKFSHFPGTYLVFDNNSENFS
jgi:hypothetical protein